MPTITTQTFKGVPAPDVLAGVIRAEYYDEVPLYAMILGAGNVRPTINEKPEWWTTSPSARRTQINFPANTYDANSTELIVDDASIFKPGDLVSAEATSEVIFIQSIVSATNTITVVRGVGGTTKSASSVANNAYLMNIGNAHGEGAGTPESGSADKVKAYNILQTFRRSVDITGRQLRGRTLTEKERPFQRREGFKEITRDINKAFLFGARSENLTDKDGKRVTTMGGLRTMVTTNVNNVAGAITKTELKAIAKTAFATGSSVKTLFGGPDLIGAIHDLYEGQRRIENPISNTGLRIPAVETPYGQLQLKVDRNFTGGFAGDGVIVDVDQLAIRESVAEESAGEAGVDEKHTGGELQLKPNVQVKGQDSRTDEFFAECTLEYGAEQNHMQVLGVTGAA